MPTSKKVKEALFAHLPTIQQGKKIIDLGSGWGHLVFPLSKKYPECEILGVECSLVPFLFSFFLNPFPHLHFRLANFHRVPLQEYDLVFCYLFPRGMAELKGKLEKELKKGAAIVSHTFAIPGWKANQTIEVDDFHRTKIYIYCR